MSADSGRHCGGLASASPHAEPGRSHVDLERGIFYRKPIGNVPICSAREHQCGQLWVASSTDLIYDNDIIYQMDEDDADIG